MPCSHLASRQWEYLYGTDIARRATRTSSRKALKGQRFFCAAPILRARDCLRAASRFGFLEPASEAPPGHDRPPMNDPIPQPSAPIIRGGGLSGALACTRPDERLPPGKASAA
jgi:hypothetical protein